MGWNLDAGALRDVPANLCRPFLQMKRAKPAQVNVLTLYHILFDGLHNSFHGGSHDWFLDARLGDDLFDDFGFGHKEIGIE